MTMHTKTSLKAMKKDDLIELILEKQAKDKFNEAQITALINSYYQVVYAKRIEKINHFISTTKEWLDKFWFLSWIGKLDNSVYNLSFEFKNFTVEAGNFQTSMLKSIFGVFHPNETEQLNLFNQEANNEK